MYVVLIVGGLVLYSLVARFILVSCKGVLREAAFTLVNLAAYWVFFVLGQFAAYDWVLSIYLPMVLLMYMAMRLFSRSHGPEFWIAFSVPIMALILARYLPITFWTHLLAVFRVPSPHVLLPSIAPFMVGLSYLAFRCSRLTLEVRNGEVDRPGFWAYLGFCFFLPTMSVGPINTYENYRRGFATPPPHFPVGRSLLRILVGSVKYLYLGTLLSQLSFAGLIQDGHYHTGGELCVAAVFSYLYLYCNFSGFCDATIGVAGLIGIPVPENFDNPFAARNVKDFWNRWHITLSIYMRDVLFSPLSKFLAHRMGPANVNHAIAQTIMCVFILVGVWHGVGWNYLAFGVVHGLGFVANHYYTIGLKKWLGRDGFKAYNSNPWIHTAAVGMTFLYVSATMLFFFNSSFQMTELWAELR